ncbi:CNH domain-containing protein [Scheffersomyces coipomensis]|uniref:CNH domain-containing protein n=1 Tax=Scheffersomyces coipomensis TaxID=1788519 RepID=UPI00315C8858
MTEPNSQATTPSRPRRRPPPITAVSAPVILSPSNPTNNYSNEDQIIITPYTTPSRIPPDNESSYFETSTYNESPRLSGPRELSDYDLNSTLTRAESTPTTYTKDYFLNRRRSYQQMSRSPTLPATLNTSPNRSPTQEPSSTTPVLHIDTNSNMYLSGVSPSPNREYSLRSRSISPTKSSSPVHSYPPEHDSFMRDGHSPTFNYDDDDVELEIEYVNKQIEALHNYTQYISGKDVLPTLPPFEYGKSDSMYPVIQAQTPPEDVLDQKLKSGKLPPVPKQFDHRSDYQAKSWNESHFKQCENIESLTSIYNWCLKLREWSSGSDMSSFSFKMSIFKLLAFNYNFEFYYNLKCTDDITEALCTYKCIQYVSYETPNSHIRILDGGVIPSRNDTFYYREEGIKTVFDKEYTDKLDENLDIDKFVKTKWNAKLPNPVKEVNVIAEIIASEISFRSNANLYVKVLAPELASLVVKECQDFNFETNVSRWAEQIIQVHERFLLRPLLDIKLSEDEPETIVAAIKQMLDIYFDWSEHVKKPLKEHFSHLIGRAYYVSKFKDQLDNIPKIRESSQNSEMLANSVFSRFSKINLQLEKLNMEGIDLESLKVAMRWIDDLGYEVNSKIERGGNRFQLARVHKFLSWGSLKKIDLDWNSPTRRFISEGFAELKWNFVMRKVTIIVLDNFVFVLEKSDKKNEGLVLFYIPTKFLLIEKKVNTDPIQFKLNYSGIKSYTFMAGENFPFQSLAIPKLLLFERTNNTLPYKLNLISNSYFAYDLNADLEYTQLYSEIDPIYECSIRDIPPASLGKYKEGIVLGNLTTSQIRCSSSFEYNHEKYIMIGSDLGLYCCKLGTTKWKLVMDGESITKIRTLEQKSLVFFLSKKRLRYFTLEKLIEMYDRNMRMSSGNLLSSGEVDFFELGQYEKEQIVIYGKREGTKTFLRTKVPVTEHGGIFNGFSSKDPFYDPGECNGVAIFREFIAIYSNKNFTIMNLNQLEAKSVSERIKRYIDGTNITDAKTRIGLDSIYNALSSSDARPMGMFRLKSSQKNEFILAYRKFAVFVNKDLNLTRSSKLGFAFVADSVAFKNDHLILVCKDVIEIWAIRNNGRPITKLVQVLAGKDIKMLNSSSLVFSMINPVLPKFRLIFQLTLATK